MFYLLNYNECYTSQMFYVYYVQSMFFSFTFVIGRYILNAYLLYFQLSSTLLSFFQSFLIRKSELTQSKRQLNPKYPTEFNSIQNKFHARGTRTNCSPFPSKLLSSRRTPTVASAKKLRKKKLPGEGLTSHRRGSDI